MLVHILFRRLSLGVGTVRGQPREAAPGKFANLSYGETHYTIYGEGGKFELNPARPLIVLVHGFAGSSAVWVTSQYLKVLSEAGFDVLTFDNYGHGFSEGPDVVYSAELFASQLAELLLALDVRTPFDLLGFSMGGAIVSVFTHRHPSLVKKLVLQAPSIARDPLFPRLLLQGLSCLPFLSEIAALLIIPHFGEGANNENDAVVRAGYRLAVKMASGSWTVGPAHQEELLSEVVGGRDVLILWGNKDRAVDFKGSDRVREICGGETKCVVGENGDHMTFAELDTDLGKNVGELFRRELLAFLGGGAGVGVGVGDVKIGVK